MLDALFPVPLFWVLVVAVALSPWILQILEGLSDDDDR